MKYDEEIQAGRETDTFIHLRIFERNDDAPPYSTDETTAEWLAAHLGFVVKPLHTLSRDLKIDPVTKQPIGTPKDWTIMMRVEPRGDKGTIADGVRFLSRATTRPLAVCRSALLLHNLVQKSWTSYDADGNEIADD